jgi:hypothetical protein
MKESTEPTFAQVAAEHRPRLFAIAALIVVTALVYWSTGGFHAKKVQAIAPLPPMKNYRLAANDMAYTIDFYDDASFVRNSKTKDGEGGHAVAYDLVRSGVSLKVFPVPKVLDCTAKLYSFSRTLTTAHGSLPLCRVGQPEDNFYLTYFTSHDHAYSVWVRGVYVKDLDARTKDIEKIISSIAILQK